MTCGKACNKCGNIHHAHQLKAQPAPAPQAERCKGDAVDEITLMRQDAARYRWLTADHVDSQTREKCQELLYRMPQMSYAAASHAIDAALAAKEQS
jgi:hypothetical protein